MAIWKGRDERFFQTVGKLGYSKQQENQITYTLVACINSSIAFRDVVLKQLGWKGPLKDSASGLLARSQVPSETGGALAYFDLVIHANRRPLLVVEVECLPKIERGQVRKYLGCLDTHPDYGDARMAVISRRVVGAERRWLEDHEVKYAEWQDIYDGLEVLIGKSGVSGFLAREFRQYLSEVGMARERKISRNGLVELQRLIHKFSTPGRQHRQRLADRLGFLSVLVEYLDEIYEAVSAKYPVIEDWGGGGPGYDNRDFGGEKQEHIDCHDFQVVLTPPSTEPLKRYFIYGFTLPKPGKNRQVQFYAGSADNETYEMVNDAWLGAKMFAGKGGNAKLSLDVLIDTTRRQLNASGFKLK